MTYSYSSLRFTTANTFFFTLFFLASFALATDQTFTRFGSDRVVQVSRCADHQSDWGTCWLVRQWDHSGDTAPRYHLHGHGKPRVIDTAMNRHDEVVIAGSFNEEISLNDSTFESAGGTDLFYLVIDSLGEVAAFDRVGDRGDEILYAVEYDAAGQFQFQGALLEDKEAKGRLFRWHLVNGFIEVQELPFYEWRPIPNSVLDEGDDPVQDPIG